MDENIKTLAFKLVTRFSKHGMQKVKRNKNELPNSIHSISTEKLYISAISSFLIWRSDMGLPISGPFLRNEKEEFLHVINEVFEQKQIDTFRQALELVFQEKLTRVKSEIQTNFLPRSYKLEQIEEIIKHQSNPNFLATCISYFSGLRDHELFTIKTIDERSPTGNRPWLPTLFHGIGEHKIYTVVGKGGLIRQVAIPIILAEQLEICRLSEPMKVLDRGIFYEPIYAIGGGQAFSQSFFDASKKALGFSNGSHGLRHSYAKNRLKTLKSTGEFSSEECLKIVSEELGHFRPEITLTYLR